MANFFSMIEKRREAGARLCIGLDVDFERLPGRFQDQGAKAGVFNYAASAITKTHMLPFAYKLNLAFYSEEVAAKLTAYIKRAAPDVPVILDAKYGDSLNTNRVYADKAFRTIGADAVTISPLPGRQALQPFLDWKDKGIFVLCSMSPEGSEELQDIPVIVNKDDAREWGFGRNRVVSFCEHVAYKVARSWNTNGNCGLVVGSTRPEKLKAVRRIVGKDMLLLSPGMGPQGGVLSETVRSGMNYDGGGLLINFSRGLIFDKHFEDPLSVIHDKTVRYGDAISAAHHSVYTNLAPV